MNTTNFLEYSVSTYTWAYPDGKTHSKIAHMLVDRGLNSIVYLLSDLSEELTVILLTV
jgi:hypothetical protein